MKFATRLWILMMGHLSLSSAPFRWRERISGRPPIIKDYRPHLRRRAFTSTANPRLVLPKMQERQNDKRHRNPFRSKRKESRDENIQDLDPSHPWLNKLRVQRDESNALVAIARIISSVGTTSSGEEIPLDATCSENALSESEQLFKSMVVEDPTGEFMSSDPNMLKAFNNTGLMYEVIRIDTKADMSFTQTEQRLSRRTLLRTSGLRPRDLRRVDPSLSLSTSGPDIAIRDNMLLINIGAVRAIVTNTSAIIFNHPSFPVRRFLRLLRNRIKANFKYAQSSDLDEQKLQVPFELVVGEAALISSSSPMEYDLIKLQPLLAKYVKSLRLKLSKETLEQLREFKQKLTLIETKAEGMRSMLLDLLDDDEDMSGLALAYPEGIEIDKQEQEKRELVIEEWEMLLEYYLLRYETLISEAGRLLEEARDLEETVSLTLSSRRLELSRIELLLSICSLAVASGAMMAGIFGMNLLSGLELVKGVFWTVFGVIFGVEIGLAWVLIGYVRRQGML
mmetsp:Transcript_4259/g.6348  ORF Transcript_4259/g.6348 Transcript_4259/m.6348 type:complete len:508 (-) Transcript_4259:11-1534(-)